MASAPSSTLFAAPTLEVRGRARAELTWRRESPSGVSRLRVEGQLQDELGEPLAELPVTLRGLDGEGAPIALSWQSCRRTLPAPERTEPSHATRSDRDGRFCAWANAAEQVFALQATPAPSGGSLYDAQTTTITLFGDPSTTSPSLELSPPPVGPHAVSLDSARASLRGHVHNPPNADARAVELRWFAPDGAELSRALCNEDGDAVLTVNTLDLGEPGATRHTLRAYVLGAPIAELEFWLETTAQLGLRWLELPSEVRAGEDLTLTVQLEGAAGSPRTPPPRTLRLEQAGAPLGARTTDAEGRARFVLNASEAGPLPLEVVVAADASGWQPPAPLRVTLAVQPARPYRNLMLAGALALMLIWFALSRWGRRVQSAPPQAARAKKLRAAEADDDSLPAPVLARLRAHGLEGVVLDEDDQRPIASVTVELRRGGFAHSEVLARALTDEQGRFDWSEPTPEPGDELHLRAPLHRPRSVPAAQPAALVVRLRSRRRAVLAEFSQWAKSQRWAGARASEPTPLEAAAHEPDPRYPRAVDRVAFGAEPVNEALDAELAPPTATER